MAVGRRQTKGDEAALAVEDFPTVAALGFGFFEFGLVEGFNVVVTKLESPAAVGSEGGDGEEDVGSGSGSFVLLFKMPKGRAGH
eukprot:scaffold16545_cov121-Isochrysis_galbana.AAC.1